MLCRNKFCVYHSLGYCTLKKIEIDANGHCTQCVYVKISEEELCRLKANTDEEIINKIFEKEKEEF